MAKEKSVSEETPLIPAAEILQDFRLDSHVQSYFRPMVSAYLAYVTCTSIVGSIVGENLF